MSEIRKRATEGAEVGDAFTVKRTFTEQDVILPGQAERKVLKAMVAEGDPTNKLNR